MYADEVIKLCDNKNGIT